MINGAFVMDIKTASTIIFLLTYAGVAAGNIPGLALDRTGIAVLGAIGMIVTGALDTDEAIRSVDTATMLLLYALMVVSAQFRLAGFYTKIAFSIVKYMKKPETFLLILMATSAILSALLANDIVCLAFTPILCVSLIRGSLNPVPFLIGLACASNIGSASTIIGNPQNMLIGQACHLDFGKFIFWCLPPSALSLVAAYFIIVMIYKGKWQSNCGSVSENSREIWNEYNSRQTTKALILITVLIILFFTPIPRELAAVAAAGILLCSRKISTRSLLGLIDWHLITLFCALFIVIAGIVKFNVPQDTVAFLLSHGININKPEFLSALTVLLSSLVSNVPAVMLLLKNIDLSNVQNLYLLALQSTFAGNLVIIGSIANIITVELARIYDVKIGFKEHARTGIPVTIVSVITALLWMKIVNLLV